MSTKLNSERSNGSYRILRKMIQQRYLYLMLLPAMTLVTIFSYKPLIYSYIAFSEYKLGFGIFDGDWVGFSYFKEFFFDTVDAGNVFYNTLFINLWFECPKPALKKQAEKSMAGFASCFEP